VVSVVCWGVGGVGWLGRKYLDSSFAAGGAGEEFPC
jgi:hypothetical protein